MSQKLSRAEFCSAEEYGQQLTAGIDQAEERILLEAMTVDAEPKAAELLDACGEARKRGAAVILIYDRFSYPQARLKHGAAGLRRLKQSLADLESAGAAVVEVGQRQLNPFAGRHHAKAAIIDDAVYVGGGVNLSSDSFRWHDYMWRFDDQPLADALYHQLPLVATSRQRDQTLYRDTGYEVLIDAGQPGQSLIYDRTCQLAEAAKSAYYVSKLMPDKQLLQALRSIDSRYWYNRIDTASGFDKLALAIDGVKHRLDNNYQGSELIHAKFCVFVMPDGSKQAISGSHNFNWRGVEFGTQEIALHITDQEMCDLLIEFAEQL